MNLQQCIAAAKDIDARYLAPNGYEPARAESGLGRPHLRWMVQQMSAGMSENKAMRWLGYIQGYLVTASIATLDEMKRVNMKAVGK